MLSSQSTQKYHREVPVQMSYRVNRVMEFSTLKKAQFHVAIPTKRLSRWGCYPAYVCVGLPQGHAAMMRDSTWQDTLLGQPSCLRVPAQYCGDDFVFVISAAGNEELVVTGCYSTAGSLAGQCSHQAPRVLFWTVSIQCLHSATLERRAFAG